MCTTHAAAQWLRGGAYATIQQSIALPSFTQFFCERTHSVKFSLDHAMEVLHTDLCSKRRHPCGEQRKFTTFGALPDGDSGVQQPDTWFAVVDDVRAAVPLPPYQMQRSSAYVYIDYTLQTPIMTQNNKRLEHTRTRAAYRVRGRNSLMRGEEIKHPSHVFWVVGERLLCSRAQHGVRIGRHVCPAGVRQHEIKLARDWAEEGRRHNVVRIR